MEYPLIIFSYNISLLRENIFYWKIYNNLCNRTHHVWSCELKYGWFIDCWQSVEKTEPHMFTVSWHGSVMTIYWCWWSSITAKIQQWDNFHLKPWTIGKYFTCEIYNSISISIKICIEWLNFGFTILIIVEDSNDKILFKFSISKLYRVSLIKGYTYLS